MPDSHSEQTSTLQWSTQLSITPPTQERGPKLPGDKITLPQSALEQLLAAAPLQAIPSTASNARIHTTNFDPFNPHTFAAESRARSQLEDRQQQLPHPLTFRIVNPQNGRFVYAGIREFSAPEDQVILSSLLRESLEISDDDFISREEEDGNVPNTTIDGVEGETQVQSQSQRPASTNPRVTVHAKQLPKGTYVRLRPLEAGYDPEDWKALLERHLRDNFTTLTVGELLTVPSSRTESFRFLLDKVYPEEEEGICIVDTDLEVDIVALSEEQARETLQKRLERAARAPGTSAGSSVGGVLTLGENVAAQVLPGEYVDYELRELKHDGKTLRVELYADRVDPNVSVSLFVSPLSARQRGRPRSDMYVWGDFSSEESKSFKIRPTNVALEGAEALYISAYAEIQDQDPESESSQKVPAKYNLRVSIDDSEDNNDHETTNEEHDMHEADDVQCQNCRQWVPQRTLVLHENFCLRNNIFCPQCQNVFQKRSPEWQNHWHCPHDSSYGNDSPSKSNHDTKFHQNYTCPDCPSEHEGLPALSLHRTTECPGKLILCQFCHLIVPQKGDSDPDLLDPEVLVSGLTPHELVDGGRTTECHLCGKIIRLRDMNTHLRHHDLERVSRPAPRICLNQNCGRTVTNTGNYTSQNKSLGLCNICFGPLYVDTHDPEGKALRRRIERRYLSQMMSGCGKPWCQNEYCKNGKQKKSGSAAPAPAMSVADIMKVTKPLVDALSIPTEKDKTETINNAPFYFCTDETGQHRRNLAEMLYAEGSAAAAGGEKGQDKAYDMAWCVAGAEAAGGDLEKTREWLAKWAPVRGETVR